MVVMKKPSGSSPDVLKNLKKKPASKMSTAEHARQMKLGLNGSQDESDEDPDVARDKGKGEKWAKMKASDRLPAYIVDMYEKEARTQASPRKLRSTMVNKLFTKQADGSYTINLQDTMYDALVNTLKAWIHLDTWIHIDRLRKHGCMLIQFESMYTMSYTDTFVHLKDTSRYHLRTRCSRSTSRCIRGSTVRMSLKPFRSP